IHCPKIWTIYLQHLPLVLELVDLRLVGMILR
ncbi:platelet-activating factor acetylhydrolase IB subunit beta isoform X4, partial [Daubentonia madagascariensis]